MATKDNHTEQDTIVVEDETLRRGFTQIPNGVLRRDDISPGAKLAYMGLLSYVWDKGSCFPGQERLAKDLGVSKRSVIRYLNELKRVKLLKVDRRGLGKTNIYTLPKYKYDKEAEEPELSNPDTPRSRSVNLALLEVTNRHIEEDEEEKKTKKDNTLRRASPKKNETGVGEKPKKSPPTNGSSPPNGSTHKLGDVIASMELPAPDPPKPASGSTLTKAERQSIRAFVHDMRGEFRDKLPIYATTKQLCNLYEEAKDKHGDKLSHQIFYNYLYESRAITRHAGHRVKGTKMGFMIGVMREKLKLDGLNEPLEHPPPSRAKPPPNPDATKMSHQDPTDPSQPDTTSQNAVSEKPELDQKQFGYTVALLKRRKPQTQPINQPPTPPNDRDISSLDKTKKAKKKQNQLQPPPRLKPSVRSGVG